jgi:DHA1 family tetracycline resistance protein-like MFS transporter
VGLLIGVFFLATFCFTCFETTLGLLISENFHLDVQHDQHAKAIVGYLFAYCGIIGALVQGGAIGRLVRRLGEAKLIALSLMLVAASLAPMPFIRGYHPLGWQILFTQAGLPWLHLLLILGILAVGSSLTRPPVFGLISMLTPAHEQGATIGVAQSAGSLARIVGPIFAATLFEYRPALPYLICSGVSLVAGFLAWYSLCRTEQPLVSGKAQSAG